jgi:site-specific recombinase XerD
MRSSRLPAVKTLEEFDFSFQPSIKREPAPHCDLGYNPIASTQSPSGGAQIMGVLQESMRTAMETRGYSESTVALYLTCVRVFAHHFGRSPLTISAGEIESFFHFLREQNKSDSTIHLYYVSLRFFYRLNNAIDQMPRLKFKRMRYRVPVILSQEKVAMILDSCESLKYKTIFTLTYASGLRISELRNLTLADIDFDRKQVYVRKGKNGHSRYSILGDKAAQLLRTYINVYGPHSFLFYNPKDCTIRISNGVIRRALRKLLMANGIDAGEVHMHTLRHCFATHLMENGTSLFHIMHLLGHVSISTTMVYLHMQNLEKLNIASPIDLIVLHAGGDPKRQNDLFAATA